MSLAEQRRSHGQSPSRLTSVDLDREIKANKTLIRSKAVAASGTTVTDVYGVGPIVAAFLIGYTSNIDRFATAGHYAAYNGTAPIEVLLRRKEEASALDERKPGVEPCYPHGRRHPDPPRHTQAGSTTTARIRQRAKPRKEALRALKRRISDTVYHQLIADHQG